MRDSGLMLTKSATPLAMEMLWCNLRQMYLARDANIISMSSCVCPVRRKFMAMPNNPAHTQMASVLNTWLWTIIISIEMQLIPCTFDLKGSHSTRSSHFKYTCGIWYRDSIWQWRCSGRAEKQGRNRVAWEGLDGTARFNWTCWGMGMSLAAELCGGLLLS